MIPSATTDEDEEILTWPRWLGRSALCGLLLAAGAGSFVVGQGEQSELSAGGGAGVAAVFGVGGFLWGLWSQVRWRYMWDASWVRAGWLAWAIAAAVIVGGGLVAGSLAT